MISEDYVSPETAKLLKEKGFNWECEIRKFYPEPDYNQESPDGVYAPTLQMTMKWLREAHNLWCEISWEGEGLWCMEVFSLVDEEFIPGSIVHEIKSYEEACEMVIKYCLENLI